jgi:hypothetical protein
MSNTNSSDSRSGSTQQAQAAVIFCESNRITLKALMDEIEKRLKAYAATFLLHGITVKCHDGFIIVEAARGIPLACLHWFRQDQRILDYVVYDVPSQRQELAAQEDGQAGQSAAESSGSGEDQQPAQQGEEHLQ